MQRKQHQIWKSVLKASAPCQNIDKSNVDYYEQKITIKAAIFAYSLYFHEMVDSQQGV